MKWYRIKNTVHSLAIMVLLAVFVSSCSNRFSLQKRKYTKGFYFTYSHKNDYVKKDLKKNALSSIHELKKEETFLVTPNKLTSLPNAFSTSQAKENLTTSNKWVSKPKNYTSAQKFELVKKASNKTIHHQQINKSSGFKRISFFAQVFSYFFYSICVLMLLLVIIGLSELSVAYNLYVLLATILYFVLACAAIIVAYSLEKQ